MSLFRQGKKDVLEMLLELLFAYPSLSEATGKVPPTSKAETTIPEMAEEKSIETVDAAVTSGCPASGLSSFPTNRLHKIHAYTKYTGVTERQEWNAKRPVDATDEELYKECTW